MNMVNHMPNPTKTASGVYYFVRRVPSDLVDVVGKDRLSYSLNTRDPKEAKRKFAEELAQVERRWNALREGPQPISYEQIVALAGLAYREISERRAHEPGEPFIWESFTALLARVAEQGEPALEEWYGAKASSLLVLVSTQN
jgi:hypothetical protein